MTGKARKSIIFTVIAVALMLSMTACGGSKMTKDEMLKDAVELEWKTVALEVSKNQVAAEQKYQGTICKMTGYIGRIYDADYIELEWYSDDDPPVFEEGWGDETEMFLAKSALRMDLEDEDAAKVLKGDAVTVVGRLDSIMVNGTHLNNAFLVEKEEK